MRSRAAKTPGQPHDQLPRPAHRACSPSRKTCGGTRCLDQLGGRGIGAAAGRAQRAAERPLASTPARKSNRNTSCNVITSPSMPTTSVMWVTRRVPSEPRLVDDHVDRRTPSARGSLAPAGRTRHQHHRLEAGERIPRRVSSMHRGDEPSWPVFMACSMSERGAVADLADDDPVGPHPQRVADQVADGDLAPALEVGRTGLEPEHVSWRSCSSAASSMVTIRSSAGRTRTARSGSWSCRNRCRRRSDVRAARVTQARAVPPRPAGSRYRTTQVVDRERIGSELPDGQHRPVERDGGTTALTRLPSGRRASTIGLASSTRRPTRPRSCR